MKTYERCVPSFGRIDEARSTYARVLLFTLARFLVQNIIFLKLVPSNTSKDSEQSVCKNNEIESLKLQVELAIENHGLYCTRSAGSRQQELAEKHATRTFVVEKASHFWVAKI